MNKIAETLSSERDNMLLSLAVNYFSKQRQEDSDSCPCLCDTPYISPLKTFPRWELNVHDNIMEIKLESCPDPTREATLLMGYFHEELGEGVENVIKRLIIIPSITSITEFSVTFRIELHPVTIVDIYFKSLLDHAEKLEAENKKLYMEANRLSAENTELRKKLDQKPTDLMVTAKLDPKCAMDIKEHFGDWIMPLGFDTYNHRKLSEQIKKIVSNPKKRTTVILWKNGDKTITKAMKGEKFDAEKGIAMAFMKYAYGNNGAYMKEIRKVIAEDQKVIAEDQKVIAEDQKVIAEDQK